MSSKQKHAPDVKPAEATTAQFGLDRALRDLVGYTMKRATNIIMADAARVLEPLGLRITTFSALSVICDTPDVTQSQLAASLNMERSNTVLIIDALEEAGLIGRHRVLTDRRSFALRATLAGTRRRRAAVLGGVRRGRARGALGRREARARAPRGSHAGGPGERAGRAILRRPERRGPGEGGDGPRL